MGKKKQVTLNLKSSKWAPKLVTFVEITMSTTKKNVLMQKNKFHITRPKTTFNFQLCHPRKNVARSHPLSMNLM